MSCDFSAFANAGIRGLSPYQAGKPIDELQRELGLTKIVKLASNENPLGPGMCALGACAMGVRDLTRYPDANGFELKRAIAEKFNVQPQQITLGNGSNDLIDLVARVYLAPNTSSVFSQYAFVCYPIATQACGARAIVTPAKDWGHDLDAMAAAIAADTRIVFIANPNNPTGTWLSRDAIVNFMKRVPEQVIVVLDEAYTEFAEHPDFPNGLELQRDYPNLVALRTFSKAYGLAALRVGYSVSHPQIADLINRVRPAFNVNSLALAAAKAALNDDDYLERTVQTNRDGMRQLIAGFDALGLKYIPSVGNFITVEFAAEAMPIYQKLLQEGVIVRPLQPYQMPNHLRVSVGLAEENAFFLDALKKVLA